MWWGGHVSICEAGWGLALDPKICLLQEKALCMNIISVYPYPLFQVPPQLLADAREPNQKKPHISAPSTPFTSTLLYRILTPSRHMLHSPILPA